MLIPQLVAIRPGPATRNLGTSRLTVTEAVQGRGRLTSDSETGTLASQNLVFLESAYGQFHYFRINDFERRLGRCFRNAPWD